MSVNLSFSFEAGMPPVAAESPLQLDNPLFSLLAAIHEEGSIGRAARRLGLSYRHVWGTVKKHEAALGQPLLAGRAGQAARLSEFGERLIHAEQRMLARFLPSAEALAAKLDNELLLAVHPHLQPLAVCTSHDLLFSALRDGVRRRAEVLLDIEYLGSAKALRRLNQGDCVLAGVHMPLDHPELCRRGSGMHTRIGRLLKLGDHKLVRFATREQGLMVAPGNPLGLAGITDLARPGVCLVNRPAGSGTRILLDELLASAGIDPRGIAGYGHEELTHLSVAAAVAAGMGNCGFGLRAAAARFHLDFVPVLKEHFFIVCRKPALETAAMAAVIEVLKSEGFRALAAAVPGYSAAEAGQIISLRRTLPWYK